MVSLFRFLNRLLPFATPGTPLIQDVLHLVAICALLFFAPQIQERFQAIETQASPIREQELEDVDVDGSSDQGLVDDLELENVVHGNDAGHQVEEEIADNEVEHLPPDIRIEEEQAGPAHAANVPNQRKVGAKKAKSLARRDQRRAYHEFMRSQSDAQRAHDAEGAAEREAILAAERNRRKAAEAALEAKKAKEREQRKEKDELERKQELHRRGLAVDIVREELAIRKKCNLCDVVKRLGGDADEEWVRKILNASGVVGRSGNEGTMLTNTGWVVRVTGEDMYAVYTTAVEADLGDDGGRVELTRLGQLLERALQNRVPG